MTPASAARRSEKPQQTWDLHGWVSPQQFFVRFFRSADAYVWLDGEARISPETTTTAPSEQVHLETGRRESVLALLDSQMVVTAQAEEPEQALPALERTLRSASGHLGHIVWLSYEAGACLETAAARTAAGVLAEPALIAAPVTELIRFDHDQHTICVEAIGSVRERGVEVQAMLNELIAESGTGPDDVSAEAAAVPVEPLIATARDSAEEYALMIERCIDEIRRGEAYQLCLTTQFTIARSDGTLAADDIDIVDSYLRLRRSGGGRGGLLRVPGHALLCASPEEFLTLTPGRRATTSPIKGTRPRGETGDADALLHAELAADTKERAENLMIVDLMRNDLSRVAEIGSVRVERVLEVESHPTVHQLVSTISAQLLPDMTVIDALRACFPAGSMTGAPKISAMRILHGLEHRARGGYAGVWGWIGEDGAAELSMVIRSAVLNDDGERLSATVGAGGGITALSDASREIAEVQLKAHPVIAALGAEVSAWA